MRNNRIPAHRRTHHEYVREVPIRLCPHCGYQARSLDPQPAHDCPNPVRLLATKLPDPRQPIDNVW